MKETTTDSEVLNHNNHTNQKNHSSDNINYQLSPTHLDLIYFVLICGIRAICEK